MTSKFQYEEALKDLAKAKKTISAYLIEHDTETKNYYITQFYSHGCTIVDSMKKKDWFNVIMPLKHKNVVYQVKKESFTDPRKSEYFILACNNIAYNTLDDIRAKLMQLNETNF